MFQDSPTEPGAEFEKQPPSTLNNLISFIFNTGSSTMTRSSLLAVSSCCSVCSASVRTAFCSATEHPTSHVLSNQITQVSLIWRGLRAGSQVGQLIQMPSNAQIHGSFSLHPIIGWLVTHGARWLTNSQASPLYSQQKIGGKNEPAHVL